MFGEKVSYSDNIDGSVQVEAEEMIASMIFDRQGQLYEEAMENGSNDVGFTEEDCGDMGRAILYVILRQFRPDLFDESKGTGG